MATDRLINKDQGDDIIDALSDIATNINTITYGPQTSADKVVAMTGYAKAETVAAISQGDTLNEAVGKLEKKADDNATAITGKTAGPESATVGDIATFNNVNGKVLNDSGISIQTSVDDTKDTEVPTSKAVGTFVSGKGYATGVATSTANHLVTFNGTDGKALKDGGATIAFNTTGVLDDDTAIPTSKAVQSYVTGKHYAGSSSDGGAATSADKLNIGNSNIGSATQPVYFDKTTGKPVAITNTIQSNVPADAVFTDTTYTVAEGTQNGKIKVTPSVGSAYEVPVHGLGNAAYKGVADTVSSSTDLVTSNAVNTKLASYVPNSDLIGVVDNGAKNFFEYFNLTCGDKSKITISENGTVSSTITTDSRYWQYANREFEMTFAPGDYVVKIYYDNNGSPAINQLALIASNDQLKICGSSNNWTLEFHVDSTVTYGIMVKALTTSASTPTVFRVMICTKAQFNISPTYEPYALGNQVITPELIELCDSGAKNLLDFANLTFQASSNVTVNKTDTQITVTTNNNIWGNAAYKMTLAAGTYYYSCKISNLTVASGTRACIVLDSGSDGHGTRIATFDVSTGTVSFPFVWTGGTLYIFYYPGYANTANSNAFTAAENMICTKAAFGVSSKFVPYRPNWDLVANTVNYVNDTFRRLDYGSNNVTTISVNVSTWQEGTYLVACNNAISNTSIKGTSVYMFTLRHSLNFLLFTKIAEMSTSENSNSNITNMSINNDTITISYEHTGYHSVYAVKL